MRKIITILFVLFTLTAHATARVCFYNTAGDFYDNEPTFRGYIVFDSESEYNSNKVFMEEYHIYPTDRELELTQSELTSAKSQELSYIIKKNNIKPGAYIIEFILKDVPGNDDDMYCIVNYKYIK